MNGNTSCCNPNVSEKIIDDYIMQLANNSLYTVIVKEKEKATNIILNVIKLKFEQIDSDKTQEANSIQLLINDNERVLEGYYDLFASASANKELLQPKITETECKIISLKEQLLEVSKNNDTLKQEILSLLDLHISIMKIEYSKKIYTLDEAISMIERLTISLNNGNLQIKATVLKAKEIQQLICEYGDNFNILTQEEQKAILQQIQALIT